MSQLNVNIWPELIDRQNQSTTVLWACVCTCVSTSVFICWGGGGGHSFHMKHFYVPFRIGASCTWDEGGQKTEFGQGHLIATISAAAPPARVQYNFRGCLQSTKKLPGKVCITLWIRQSLIEIKAERIIVSCLLQTSGFWDEGVVAGSSCSHSCPSLCLASGWFPRLTRWVMILLSENLYNPRGCDMSVT